MVLNLSSWTFSSLSNVILPIELQTTFNSFDDFYSHRHSDRKLTWLHQYSIGELQTNFTNKKYILHVTTYQIIVLLLCREELNWTVEEIQDKTQIPSKLLLQILSSLLISKIVYTNEINEDFQDSDIKLNHRRKDSGEFD
ncbi:unnamed protein product [Rotaria sp. Silwood1]|nr:unnamed protein product [Rotaria sp. Silwood1]CAF4552803.1 unnamed protein product [Rotaria sp. Silwood1]CAF4759260.1 unnamed protein product [Rotaria sp. Silwood1]